MPNRIPWPVMLEARSRLKNGRGPGGDNLVAEVVKNLPLRWIYILWCWFGMFVAGYPLPESWASSPAMMIPKCDKPNSFGKFRTIILDAILLKYYLCVLYLLTQPYFLRCTWTVIQCGGRPGAQPADLVLLMRLIGVNHHRWVYPDFVCGKADIFKAFDRIHQSKILAMHDAINVPKWLSFAHAMTLTKGIIVPIIDRERAPDVACTRGCRQGRVESMRNFCAT
eukprot:10783939-Karenia_brevis.AAC.1